MKMHCRMFGKMKHHEHKEGHHSSDDEHHDFKMIHKCEQGGRKMKHHWGKKNEHVMGHHGHKMHHHGHKIKHHDHKMHHHGHKMNHHSGIKERKYYNLLQKLKHHFETEENGPSSAEVSGDHHENHHSSDDEHHVSNFHKHGKDGDKMKHHWGHEHKMDPHGRKMHRQGHKMNRGKRDQHKYFKLLQQLNSDGPMSPENSPIVTDGEKFEINLNVKIYKPEDITVKLADNYLVVECKHEEREDQYGLVSRHTTRKYKVPEGHDLDLIVSELSEDGGVMKITIPKIKEMNERNIPIIRADSIQEETLAESG